MQRRRTDCYVPIVLKIIDDVYVESNIVKHEPINVHNDPIRNQPIEPTVEITLRRFQMIKRFALSDDVLFT